MPTPDGLKISTLHGKFVEPNSTGTPLKGTLTFTPFPSVITFPTQNVIVTGTETATLDDITGEFSIDLISTDQTGENPTGWVYSVTEKLSGQKSRSYLISLPFTNGTVVELADVTPTDAAPTYIPVVGPVGAPGIVTTVNGYSSASITLGSADVGALALTTRGAANGVASLDATTHVPVAQIPDISATYVTVARIAAANGVASLGSGGLVPSTQLDLATATPTAIADAGVVGTATKLARENHTHSGVALTGNQSIAGNKTWSGSAYFTGTELGVGITSGLSAVADLRTAVAGTSVMNLQNTNGASTASLLKLTGDTSNALLVGGLVVGDAFQRVAVRGSGQLEFGSGSIARDVNLYRSAVGILNSSGQLASDVSAPVSASHLTRKDYVDGLDGANVKLTGAQTVAGVKTLSAAPVLSAGATVSGTLTVNAAINVTTSSIMVSRAATTNPSYRSQVSGDTNDRFSQDASGKMSWGPGNAVSDSNFYRNGAGIMKTDGQLQVGGLLTALASLNLAGVNLGETQTYTPTWSGITNQGTGPTKWGYWWRIGNLILVSAGLLAGTSPSLGTATVTVSLPVAGSSLSNIGTWGKSIGHPNDGTSWKEGSAYVASAGTTATIFATRQTDLGLVSPGTAGWVFIAGSSIEAWFWYPTA